MIIKFKKFIKFLLKKIRNFLNPEKRFTDSLVNAIYHKVHDLESSLEIIPNETKNAFNNQWEKFPSSPFLLSDKWFKKNVVKILSEQELLIDSSWFKGKSVLDAGCGNGRWSYAFSKLESTLTCVDASLEALDTTKREISIFNNKQKFINSDLENIHKYISKESYDLVFSWGVLHHCKSFNRALKNISNSLKKGGIIYLYLYGKESHSFEEEIELFKERLNYNLVLNNDEREKFLLSKTKGKRENLHIEHDIYAPLINRRFTFSEIKKILLNYGFEDIKQTINHSEIFVRASKGPSKHSEYYLSKSKPPYWFQRK